MPQRLVRALKLTVFYARLAIRRTFEALLALIILFEEWGWRPLAALVARLARWSPWAVVESKIAALPPYGALAVFVLPSALLFPLKLLSFWLIAHGQALAAGALFLAAKVVGTGLVARIFQLTRPTLMQLRWFAWVYERVIPWKEALLAHVRASWAWRQGRIVKERLRRIARTAWSRLVPRLEPVKQRIANWLGRWRRPRPGD